MKGDESATGGLSLGLLILAGSALVVALVVFLSADPRPSADGIIALISAALGIVGTHVGHVTGHRLGKQSRME